MKSQLLVAGAILQSSLVLADAPAVKTSSVSGFFVEQFQDGDWENKWSPSEATKEGYGGGETMQYSGVWNVEEPTVYPGLKGDKGLVVKSTATHHAISVPFASKLDPKGKKSFVVQYEVKLQKGLDCGGAYIKLLTDGEEGIQAKEFSDKTPYTVMFGPDKCGGTQKVHLIIRHQNPLTGEFQEKHLKNPPMPKTDKLTNLYTLIINDDQTYEIKINDESAKSGSLLEDFQPPFNPPKEIDDPEDSKPEDWIDNPKMVDPDAVKPDDWDEDAPMEIPDEEAEKPEGWLDNEPATIPDPDAEKPEEWDDDEDGDWIAPSVPNPKCEDAVGCGEWVKPSKPNPDYKGPWYAPYIDNPEYKGVWTPRQIPNPDFYEDLTPSNLNPIQGIGIELWTMTSDILFDNFYIGFSKEDAEAFAKDTYHLKRPVEEEVQEKEKPKTPEPDSPFEGPSFAKDPLGFIQFKLASFAQVATVDPIGAFKEQPQTGAAIVAAFIALVGLLGSLMSLIFPAPKEASKKVKEVAEATTEKATAATTAVKNAAAETTSKKRAGKGKSKADE